MQQGWTKVRGRGVEVVTVLTAARGDAMEGARAFQKKHGLTHPVLVDADGTAGKRFALRAFPTHAVLDGKGVIRYMGEGFDPIAIDQTLQKLLGW